MDFESFNRQFAVPRETFEQFTIYHDLLVKWQKSINLISPSDIPHIWTRHILDSCQFALTDVPRETSILDLGSGAGFPGMALSILGFSNVTMVESDSKKCIFLEEVARHLGVQPTICNQRIEALLNQKWQLITARGCASLSQLLTWSYPLLTSDSSCLFAKGKNYAKEIEMSEAEWRYDYVATPSITDSESVLLTINHLTPRQP